LTPAEAMRDGAPLVVEHMEEDDEAAAHATVSAGAVKETLPRNVANRYHFTRGDIAQGVREADVVIERTYTTGRLHQAYMEPHATIAAPDSGAGTVTALQARMVFDSGASPGAPASIAAMLLGGYYKTPHLDIESMEVLTHKPPNGAYRAPGAPQATFAIESQMNDMAQQLGLDPVEFRLRNASDTGDPMPNGRPWQKLGLRQVLQVLHEHP